MSTRLEKSRDAFPEKSRMEVTACRPVFKLVLHGSVFAAITAFSLAVLCPSALTQSLAGCAVGRKIMDDRGGAGTIVGARGTLCVIKYEDGRSQAWVPVEQLRDAGEQSVRPISEGDRGNVQPPPVVNQSSGPVVIRPAIINREVYPVDALGHVTLTARVDGAQVKFLVDTGASLVGLTLEDAKAAGIDPGRLIYNQTVQTAAGTVKAASTQIREIRIDQAEVDDVPAVVVENLKQSVLGMSFLKRLKSFDIRDGFLTLSW